MGLNITELKQLIAEANEQLDHGQDVADNLRRVEEWAAQLEAQRRENRESARRKRAKHKTGKLTKVGRVKLRIERKGSALRYFQSMRDRNPEYYDRLIRHAELDLLGMAETLKDWKQDGIR